MPGALQSKGDGEYPYSAPFTGLNVSIPSILLPSSAQEAQCSPSFSIVRGSIAAPWPYADSLYGFTLGSGEYLLFSTASGYVITNLYVYQIQGVSGGSSWGVVPVAAMPSEAFPSTGNGNPVPFVESNGCLYFSCQLGIYRYGPGPVTGISALVGTSGSLPSQTYLISITAVVDDVESHPCANIQVVVPAHIPPREDGSIALTWAAVPGASSYNVYVGTSFGEGCDVFSSSTNSLTITSYTSGESTPPAILEAWSVAFAANFLTISNQRMIAVGTSPVSENTTPGTPSGTQGTGGSLADNTYYAIVTAVFPSGTEGPPSSEGSVTVSGGGGTASIDWTWTAVDGAVSYNIYIGTEAGEENVCYSSSTNSYELTSYSTEASTSNPWSPSSPPIMPPFSPWGIAWSAVSAFSDTSIGIFNSNPNTSNSSNAAGVVGGYDVLTSYSQGIPVGIINLGHSFYVQMTQGIVEVDPAQNGTSAFTLYNYWQENIPVGAIPGTVAQYGPISAFVTPDNVDIWIPGQQTQIGAPVMPLIRKLLLNAQLQGISGASWPLIQNPPVNSTFLTIYGELHYVLTFNIYGVPPQQFAPPYPDQISTPQWFGLILDYNFASQSWAQQVTPPLTTQLYQVNGPPLTTDSFPLVPPQSILVGGTQANPDSAPGLIVFGPDVFNQLVWVGDQCQGLESQPQQCQVGFPQTPISPGHRPANRRVRIEYSMDEMTCATQTAAVDMTVSLQGTITQNTGSPGGNGVATTTIQTISKTIQIQPTGVIAAAEGNPVVPFLTATAYADMVLSLENPQVSLSWTDPSAHQRLLVHRVTLVCNDTKGTFQ